MGLDFAGKTFGGYRVGDLLDSGPHGVLHAAEHTSSGDKVAIKIFAADLSRDKNAASRLVSDVQRAVAVTHPNIIAVREVGTAEFKGKRHLFVAMERLQGESLKSLLAKQKGQPLSLRQVLHIVSELGAALDAIHRNNGVHRLLHPGAVFLSPADRDSDESRVLVLDLGASLVPTGDDKKAKAGGKPQDDLRALAQLAVDMLAGADGANDGSQAILPLRLRNRAVPARVDAVLRSVLGDTLGTGDKASRYDSAAAFVAALLGTGETQPRFGSWSEDGRTFPAPKKSHGTLLWAGLFAVAGGLALGYYLFTSEPGNPPAGGQPANPPTQVTDLGGQGPAGARLHAADAGGDAGSGQLGGPGHWPQRPGGKIPDVRAADAWPVQNVTPGPGPTPPSATANPVPAAKDVAASGAPALPIKPAAATQPSPPSAAPGAAASPAGVGSTPAAKPVAAAPTTAAKPAAGIVSPGGTAAGAPGSPGAAAAAKPAASPASPTSTAKPAGAASTGNTATVPAAKPPAPAATGGGPAAQGAKPATQAPSGPVGGSVSAPAAAKPSASPATPGTAAKPSAAPVATGPAAKPAASAATPGTAAKPAAAPAATGPAAKPSAAPATPGAAAAGAGAKPAVGAVGAAPAAGPTTPRSPSAPAAPAGASSAAKTPETRPSSTGGSAPAAKPATSSGGSSGPQ